MLRFAPDVLPHPGWLLRFAKSRRLPDLSVPNLQPPGGGAPPSSAPTESGCRPHPRPGRTWHGCARVGWPLSAQGVTRVDDAQAGRRRRSLRSPSPTTAATTSTPPPPPFEFSRRRGRSRPPDRGPPGRRHPQGGDVAKALALGARAVLIGRAYLWGLAANGQAGVEDVLDILRGGLDSAVLGLGHSSVHELMPDDLVIPPGFRLELGACSGRRSAARA
ncbi:alpha-hydroxy-acid oxidizing protein [Streptomyces sp. L7]